MCELSIYDVAEITMRVHKYPTFQCHVLTITDDRGQKFKVTLYSKQSIGLSVLQERIAEQPPHSGTGD